MEPPPPAATLSGDGVETRRSLSRTCPVVSGKPPLSPSSSNASLRYASRRHAPASPPPYAGKYFSVHSSGSVGSSFRASTFASGDRADTALDTADTAQSRYRAPDAPRRENTGRCEANLDSILRIYAALKTEKAKQLFAAMVLKDPVGATNAIQSQRLQAKILQENAIHATMSRPRRDAAI